MMEALEPTAEMERSNAALMIPRWLLVAARGYGIGAGVVLIYGCMLRFAGEDGLEGSSEASVCETSPSELARATGLTRNYARRAIRQLIEIGLLSQIEPTWFVFQHHPMMGAEPSEEDGSFLNVQKRWADRAIYLPASVAKWPTGKLSPGEKIFFAMVRLFEKRRWRVCAARQVTLANEMGVGIRQIQKYVASLEIKGLIDVTDNRPWRRANTIRTHIIARPLGAQTRIEARTQWRTTRKEREASFGSGGRAFGSG